MDTQDIFAETLKILHEKQKTNFHATTLSNRKIAEIVGVHHRTVASYFEKVGLTSNRRQKIDIIDNDNARCKKCNQVKILKEFQFGRKGKTGEYRFAYCNACRKNQNYLNLNSDIHRFLSDRFNRLKLRADKNNIPCSITKKQFIEQYHKQNGLCFYTDAKLICEVGNNLNRDSLSVDKINPEKGYVFGNVVFSTHRINTCKCDLSLEEIKRWMPIWHDRITKFIGDL